MRFDDVHVYGVQHSAFTLNNTQVFQVVFEHCSWLAVGIGMENIKGSFSWKHGTVAWAFASDFFIPSVFGDAQAEIDDVETENSRQFLNVSSGTFPGGGLTSLDLLVKIKHITHDGLGTGCTPFDIAANTCTPSGHYILFDRPGTLVIETSRLNVYGYHEDIFFTGAYNNLPQFGPAVFSVTDSSFGFGPAAAPNDIFGTTIQDNFDTAAGGSTPSFMANVSAFSTNSGHYLPLGNYSSSSAYNHLYNIDSTTATAFNSTVQNILTANRIQSFATTNGAKVFTGTGLNDATFSGNQTNPYPGTYQVQIYATGTSGGPDTFIWNDAGGGIGLGPSTITAATCTSNVVTATDASHGIISTGTEFVTITGASPSGYNVTLAAATRISTTQFSYPVASCPAAWVSGGTVVAWIGPIPILGGSIPPQNLELYQFGHLGWSGIMVQFAAKTGHTVGDTTSMTVAQNQATAVGMFGVNGGIVPGTASNVGPIQAGYSAATITTFSPLLDSGNINAGAVLVGARDNASHNAFGFAARATNTVSAPWFTSANTYGTNPHVPAHFSTYQPCATALAGNLINVDDSTTQTVGATVTGGGSYAVMAACDAGTTSWYVVSSKGAASAGAISALTGDGTATGPGSVALTLASVNSNVGTCGDSTHYAIPVFDIKGRATSCTTQVAPSVVAGTGVTVTGPVAGAYTVNGGCHLTTSTGTACTNATCTTTTTVITAITIACP
jgi:hypothetical protein